MTNEEYIKILHEEVFPKVICSGGMPPQVVEYFNGHFPRFEAQLNMFHKHLDDKIIGRVYDIGTGTPFTSYYFNKTQGAEVIYGCPLDGLAQLNLKCFGLKINLCKPQPMAQADLVIATEVLEHLPCNVYRAYFYLSKLVRVGGYLLVSFPLGGAGAGNYHRDDMGDHERAHDGHIREYTMDTARQFYVVNGFELIEEAATHTNAYGGVILNVLLKRTV